MVKIHGQYIKCRNLRNEHLFFVQFFNLNLAFHFRYDLSLDLPSDLSPDFPSDLSLIYLIDRLDALSCYGSLVPIPMDKMWVIMVLLTVSLISDGITFLIHKKATEWDLFTITEQYRFTALSRISLAVISICCVALSIHILSMWSAISISGW